MPQPFDDDSTVRLTRPVPSDQKPSLLPVWAIAAAALCMVFALLGGWLLWPSKPATNVAVTVVTPPSISAPPSPATPQAPPQPLPATPETSTAVAPAAVAPLVAPPPPPVMDFAIETATEQQILDHTAAPGSPDPTVFRFAPNPRVLVLDFQSLLDQGRMLNRVAALMEKSGLPHDRVLSDAELDTAVRAGGDTVETFYYGHDYGAREVLRFFALADRDNVRLVNAEYELRRLIRQDGWFEPEARAALISIPRIGADEHVTRLARATILHHELSHGEYFTNPDYVAFVHRFWTRALTTAERDRIRRHLHSLGYDSALEEVMENEAQAYLMFTENSEFFSPDMIGMSRGRLAELRNVFFQTMPAGWLRDSLGASLLGARAPAPPALAAPPVAAPTPAALSPAAAATTP